MLYSLLRTLLFRLEPENAHYIALKLLQWRYRLGFNRWLYKLPAAKPLHVMGLNFPNPVGLAAGLDKNGDYIDALGSLGFGFIEVGTVTPTPQPGNPKPRLFRLTQHKALINRLGFNNKGVDYCVARLKSRRYTGVVGVNIGKNRTTPVERAAEDYCYCLTEVFPYADYVTVNISSPNTPDLRNLQFGEHLQHLLTTLQNKREELSAKHQRNVPLVVKLAPDLSGQELAAIADTLLTCRIDGVIATNTTISRTDVEGSSYADETGGLSGQPLLQRSTEVVRELSHLLQGKIPIIAVGGIFSAEDAQEKFAAGASLVQLYTGLIYRGPELVQEALKI